MAKAAPEPLPEVRCEQCGFPVAEANERLEDALEAIDGLQRDLIGKRSQIKRLEGEAADRLERHKHYSAAVEVLAYWKAQLAPKAREIVSEARLKPTIARLSSGHTKEGLMGAIDGYAKFPYVVKAKRCPTGHDSQRYVDVGLIFRDAAHVEEGLRLAKRDTKAASPSNPVDMRLLDWRAVRYMNHKTILAVLSETQGRPYFNNATMQHEAECPRCKRQLRIYAPEDTNDSLLQCSGCMMNEGIFFAALRDTKLPPAVDIQTMRALDALEEIAEQRDLSMPTVGGAV
jgi:hypothetical protein